MLFLFSLLHLSSVFLICSSQPVTNATEIAYILSDHNNARATLAKPVANNMVKLRWDPIAAQMAYNYLKRTACTASNFSHNPNRSIDYWNLGGRNGLTASNSAANPIYVGENWYSGKPTNLTDTTIFGGATKMWTDGDCNGGSCCPWTCTHQICSEVHLFYQDATVNGQACTLNGPGEWGHFTQVMWATTQWVGCGYTPSCGTLCDYVVGGNFNLPAAPTAANIWGVGGNAASKCPNGTSPEGGLCAFPSGSSPKKSNGGGIAAAVIIILLLLILVAFIVYKRHKDPTWNPCASLCSSSPSTTTTSTPASPTGTEQQTFVRSPEKSVTTPADIASPSGARSPSTYLTSPTSPTSPTGVAFAPLPQSPPPVSPSSPQVWEKIWDENQQSFYYSNPKSGVTQWEKPAEYVE